MKSICVFCGSNLGKNSNFEKIARELGQSIANKEMTLVYGGANVGLMRCTAEAAIENNGKTIGVITHFLAKKHLSQKGLTELISVETMQERKAKMTELADAFVVLPGGCGSMEELFEVFTAAQLGFHKKPIVIINTDGYYNTLKLLFDEMIKQGLMLEPHVNMLHFTESINDAFSFMEDYEAPVMDKWIDDIRAENGH